jgi:hypothetical protein
MRNPTDEEIINKCPEVIDKSKVSTDKRHHRMVEKNKRGGGNRKTKWHSEEDRIRVASVYAVTGSAKTTSEITGIPQGTIRQWKTQPWWPEIISRVRQEHDDEIDVKITKIIDKTLNQVQDRLENGDMYVLRDGTMVNKPMGGKEIAVVASIMFDKRDMIRRKEKGHIAEQSTKQVLTELLNEFRRFTSQKTVEGEVLEREVEDAEPAGDET